MRESKFRGYSDYHKMWYYGSIVKIHRRYYIYNTYGNRFEVIPESIGEYTGLKDKNGKEIYEGDICRFTYYIDLFSGEQMVQVAEIVYNDNDCCFYAVDRKIEQMYFMSQIKPTCEVIGHIHA